MKDQNLDIKTRVAASHRSRKAIYAGSFDPLTNGHLWIIERCSTLFDHLTIAIGENAAKTYFLSTEQRRICVEDALNALPDSSCVIDVQVMGNTYLAKYAESHGADCLVRGIRSEADFSYEYAMSLVNRRINPNIETIYLMPPPELAQLSSSLVKSMIGPDSWEQLVQTYVPRETLQILKQRSQG